MIANIFGPPKKAKESLAVLLGMTEMTTSSEFWENTFFRSGEMGAHRGPRAGYQRNSWGKN